jgi:hypothetical protein
MNQKRDKLINFDASKRQKQLGVLLKLTKDSKSNKFLVCKDVEEAKCISKSIIDYVDESLVPILYSFNSTITSTVNKENGSLHFEINRRIRPRIESVNKSMKELDIAVQLKAPDDISKNINNSGVGDISAAGVSMQKVTTYEPKLKERNTIWGTFIRAVTPEDWELGRDWEAHEQSKNVQTVDLDKLKEEINKKIGSYFHQMDGKLNDLVAKNLESDLKNLENGISDNLNEWLDVFSKQLNDKTEEKDKQKRLKDALEATKEAHHALKQDVDATQQEMRLLLGA